MRTRPVSLDALGPNAVAVPTPSIASPRLRLPWRTMADALADPAWCPTWDQAPIWCTEPDAIVEQLTNHPSSDSLTRRQVTDLAARLCRRNAVAATKLVESFSDPDPRASLLAQCWDRDDWSRLWWVRAELRWQGLDHEVEDELAGLLARRYSQYADQPFSHVLVFAIDSISGWSASANA